MSWLESSVISICRQFTLNTYLKLNGYTFMGSNSVTLKVDTHVEKDAKNEKKKDTVASLERG